MSIQQTIGAAIRMIGTTSVSPSLPSPLHHATRLVASPHHIRSSSHFVRTTRSSSTTCRAIARTIWTIETLSVSPLSLSHPMTALRPAPCPFRLWTRCHVTQIAVDIVAIEHDIMRAIRITGTAPVSTSPPSCPRLALRLVVCPPHPRLLCRLVRTTQSSSATRRAIARANRTTEMRFMRMATPQHLESLPH